MLKFCRRYVCGVRRIGFMPKKNVRNIFLMPNASKNGKNKNVRYGTYPRVDGLIGGREALCFIGRNTGNRNLNI